ncbi:MAG TPA: aldolase/citrate lyase family protein [Devosia sp.]|nr:aldolase/citrate lyase family protein [Devosia sp.]
MPNDTLIDTFADRLRARPQPGLVTAWLTAPAPLLVSHMAREAFDAILFDIQHGMHDMQSSVLGIAAARAAGRPALARIPVGDYATAARLLDAGASGIIAPMVSTVEEARALVTATRFPPVGQRSWGPSFVLSLSGETPDQYLRTANSNTIVLAMIETAEALANVDAILSVEGLDGVFLGPSDLSIALTNGASLAPHGPEVDRALATMLERCRAHKKIAGAFGADGARAAVLLGMGYDLVAAGNDMLQLRLGARAELAAARRT